MRAGGGCRNSLPIRLHGGRLFCHAKIAGLHFLSGFLVSDSSSPFFRLSLMNGWRELSEKEREREISRAEAIFTYQI